MITAALLRTLRKRGLNVQPFKIGPDYIDPMYHRLASGRPCLNLDSWIMNEQTIISSFVSGSERADLAIIEGVRGLYEGESAIGELGSTAHVAKILKSPVIIVLNCKSLTKSAAAQIQGLQSLDKEVNIVGVILNKVSGIKHEEKLRQAISYYTGLPILGSLYRHPELEISKRHLGLVTSHELPTSQDTVDSAAVLLERSLDIDKLLQLAKSAPPLRKINTQFRAANLKCKIGIFVDAPFSFYYHENIELLKGLGAEICTINSISDRSIKPDVSGVIIGGGYPEVFSKELEDNFSMRQSLKKRISDGMPVIGECGGLLYLCKSIEFNGERRKMVGLFDCEVAMCNRPKALSYVELESQKNSILSSYGERIRGHEFHYSSIEDISGDFAFKVLRGTGIKDRQDGITLYNAIGMYTHLHYHSCPNVPKRFLKACVYHSRQ